MSVAIQRKILNDFKKVLKKYSIHGYDPETVIEILSRSLRRKNATHQELVKDAKKVSPSKILHLQRKQLNLSLSELSKKSGIPKSNLSAMENGKRTIGLKIAKILAPALGINYVSLL
jgi:ribosome-binding protein aMBF1 (putative translation factor)